MDNEANSTSPVTKRRKSRSSSCEKPAEVNESFQINADLPEVTERPPVPPKRKRSQDDQLLPTSDGRKRTKHGCSSCKKKRARRKSAVQDKDGGQVARRRSSFVVGRISKSVPTQKSSELYTSIPQDLPEDQRLEMLYTKAAEHSLEKMEDEFPDLADFRQFKIKAMDAVQTSIAKLREDGTFKSMVVTKEKTEDQEVEEKEKTGRLEAYIQAANSDLAKFTAESQAWDKLVERFKQEAEKQEMLSQEEPTKVVMESPPSGLSEKQRAFLDAAPKYGECMDRLEYLHQSTLLAISAISRAAKQQERLLNEAQVRSDEYSRVIYNAAFPSNFFEHINLPTT